MAEVTAATIDYRDLQARQLSMCEAALALWRKQKPEAVRLLVTLSRDGDPVVRMRVAECLMEIGNERAIMGLMDLAVDPHAQVRSNALGALGALRAPEARGRMERALKSDPEMSVRIIAARALGKLNDRSGLLLIIRLLDEDNEYYRRSAVMALRDIIGQSFPPTQEGIRSAKRYLEMNKKRFFSGGSL